eukprot:2017306-Rhodomonas_salina.2
MSLASMTKHCRVPPLLPSLTSCPSGYQTRRLPAGQAPHPKGQPGTAAFLFSSVHLNQRAPCIRMPTEPGRCLLGAGPDPPSWPPPSSTISISNSLPIPTPTPTPESLPMLVPSSSPPRGSAGRGVVRRAQR